MKKYTAAFLTIILAICIISGVSAESNTRSYSISVPVRYLDSATPYTQNKTVTVCTGMVLYAISWSNVTINNKKYLYPSNATYTKTDMSLGLLGDSDKSYWNTFTDSLSVTQYPEEKKLLVTSASFEVHCNRHTEGICLNGAYSYYGSQEFSATVPCLGKTYYKKLK